MAEKRTQLETVIQTAIDTALKEVHVCYPAIVTKVNHEEQLIDAQITIKRKMGAILVELPLLVDVPLRYWRSKTFSITFPIEIGDHVKVYFCERSIDNWLLKGGIQDPFDVRKFSLSDAFAEPCMYHQEDVIPDFDIDDLEIKTNSGDTKITVHKDEGVTVLTTGQTVVTSAKTIINNDVDIIGDVSITGNLDVSGYITAIGNITGAIVKGITAVIVGSLSLGSHVHSQGNDSNGDSQQDTGGPHA